MTVNIEKEIRETTVLRCKCGTISSETCPEDCLYEAYRKVLRQMDVRSFRSPSEEAQYELKLLELRNKIWDMEYEQATTKAQRTIEKATKKENSDPTSGE